MRWAVSDDVEAYAAAVTAYLEAEPCRRNVLRWVIEVARRGQGRWVAPPGFFWLEDAGAVAAAAHWTAPFNLQVSSGAEEAAPALAGAARRVSARSGVPIAGVSGPRDAAAAVARAWSATTGAAHRLHMAETLYALESVRPVRVPPGRHRLASHDEIELLTGWLIAFSAEVRLPSGPDPEAVVGSLVRGGLLHLWLDGGEPVSMAARRQPVAGVVRVGPVYTPPQRRGHGYARRLVAEVSAAALSQPEVRHCMLYADAANPVSNSIYSQIGYSALEEHCDFAFETDLPSAVRIGEGNAP